jgi:hypothetical protein
VELFKEKILNYIYFNNKFKEKIQIKALTINFKELEVNWPGAGLIKR